MQKEEHTFTRCQQCSLERIDPQPTDATLAKIYGEHYYDAWGLQTDRESVEAIKRGTFERVLKGLGDLPRGARVLDCGAATGFLMQVAQGMGWDPFGAELSEFGAGEIAKRFGKDHVHQGQLEAAPWSDGHFDAVTMCDYVEHVRDPEGTLRRVHCLLKKGGKVAITMPRVGSATYKAMGPRWTHYKIEHLYYFSVKNLGQLLGRIGFGDYTGRALVKTMNIRYMAHQFDVYPHPVLTPIVRGARAIVPGSIQRANFPIAMGELVAYATKV